MTRSWAPIVALCACSPIAIHVEHPAPAAATATDFTLPSHTGKVVTLSEVRGPVLLVFYRGFW